MVCEPTGASHSHTHCRHRSALIAAESVAGCQLPPSTRTSTAEIPRCCDQATPATITRPAWTVDKGFGVSIRELVLIGASCFQPRRTQ
jgi:hypothetical protein